MDLISSNALAGYWSSSAVGANLLIFFNLVGALGLGLLVGYERAYHGHAAGMRTYGLVCMASAALTVVAGYPDFWFGGRATTALNVPAADATRVVQGIVTGVGFLGAGVIMKEGFSIRGLNTAASIWASSAIGITVGLGFYAAAILLALLSTMSMAWVSRLEQWLPAHGHVAVTVQFKKGFCPREPPGGGRAPAFTRARLRYRPRIAFDHSSRWTTGMALSRSGARQGQGNDGLRVGASDDLA
jgi:putative Mg2+ transporter-C (MgtC) family protein